MVNVIYNVSMSNLGILPCQIFENMLYINGYADAMTVAIVALSRCVGK